MNDKLTPDQRMRLYNLLCGDEVCEVDEVMSAPPRPLPSELEERLVRAALDVFNRDVDPRTFNPAVETGRNPTEPDLHYDLQRHTPSSN